MQRSPGCIWRRVAAFRGTSGRGSSAACWLSCSWAVSSRRRALPLPLRAGGALHRKLWLRLSSRRVRHKHRCRRCRHTRKAWYSHRRRRRRCRRSSSCHRPQMLPRGERLRCPRILPRGLNPTPLISVLPATSPRAAALPEIFYSVVSQSAKARVTPVAEMPTFQRNNARPLHESWVLLTLPRWQVTGLRTPVVASFVAVNNYTSTGIPRQP